MFPLLGERGKIPDHAVLIAGFKTTYTLPKNSLLQKIVENKRYKLKSIPNDLYASDLSAVYIRQIERTRETHTNINEIYSILYDVIIIPRFSTRTNTRNALK